MSKHLLVPAFVISLSAFAIQHSPLTQTAAATTLSLHLLGHRIGQERSDVTSGADGGVLRSHFEYLDRGTTVALDSTLTYSADLTPVSFESHGKSYRYFSVDVSVPAGARPPAAKSGAAPNSFMLEGVAPLSAQALLVRYWLAHGTPGSISILPSGDAVSVRESALTVVTDAGLPPLRQFTIDGVSWGRQRLWLRRDTLELVAAVSSVGVLGFEAVPPPFEPAAATFARAATHARLEEAATESAAVPPMHRGTFADAAPIDIR